MQVSVCWAKLRRLIKTQAHEFSISSISSCWYPFCEPCRLLLLLPGAAGSLSRGVRAVVGPGLDAARRGSGARPLPLLAGEGGSIVIATLPTGAKLKAALPPPPPPTPPLPLEPREEEEEALAALTLENRGAG